MEDKKDIKKLILDSMVKYCKDQLDKQDEKMWMEGRFIDSPMVKFPTPNWN